MSQRELSPSHVRPVQILEATPSPESGTPDFVIYAGTSHRRVHFLKYAFPNSTVLSFPAGPEDKTHEVDKIMTGKIEAVLPKARGVLLQNPGKSGIVVAADIESFPLIYENGRSANQGKGKPKDLEEVRHNFEAMYEAARRMSEAWGAEVNPYYLVNAASGVRDLETGSFYPPKHHGCIIELEGEKVRTLGTPAGFERYVDEFVDFFSSPRYSYNGVHPPITPMDVAGGFDTSVLAKMGAIRAIDTVQRNDPSFRDTLSYLINHSNIGIHSTVLRPYSPDIDQRIKNWPWLQKVTDYAMGLN